jgi:hypothetical protein
MHTRSDFAGEPSGRSRNGLRPHAAMKRATFGAPASIAGCSRYHFDARACPVLASNPWPRALTKFAVVRTLIPFDSAAGIFHILDKVPTGPLRVAVHRSWRSVRQFGMRVA